ncbi:MAG: hypothetical protein GY778_27790, partial [bacterium]|nr:hypothetical protein [bacterium]
MGITAEFIGKLIQAAANYVDRCLPEYEPGRWNDDTVTRKCNNCYNYGCDIQTDNFAQPGYANGVVLNWPADGNCEAVTAGALADGLVTVDCDQGCGCSECRHQVALVIDPGEDYHWYRKDRDGRWSHKPGSTAATNLDNSGAIITDPRTADRGGYTVFCSCFCVNKENVAIAGSRTDCTDWYADQAPAAPQVIATFGLFSGRPNPELPLDPEAARKLGELAAAVRGAEASPPPRPVRLGEYYGIEIGTPGDLA